MATKGLKLLSVAALCSTAVSQQSYECTVKQTALEFANTIGGKQAIDNVYAALDFPQGCPRPSLKATGEKVKARVGGRVFYVSPGGNDAADGGSEVRAFQTLEKARDAVRGLTTAERQVGVRVEVMSGTHYLPRPLELNHLDNGVTWSGTPSTVVSGGVKLNCTWSATSTSAVECTTAPVMPFMEVFVNGVRRVRARYPNGDPLIPHSGYASGCSGHSQTSTARGFPINTKVTSASGKEIASVCTQSAGSITVADMDGPRDINNCKTQQSLYYNTRFNETYNNPFWDTTSIKAMTVTNSTVKSRMAQWKDPAGVVVKMYHPSAWGGWGFLASSVSGDVVQFAKGGDQEARGGSGCGDYYFENVEEELDAPEEWFYNEKTRVLSYIPATDAERAALLNGEATVEVSVNPMVWSIRGTPEQPAKDITIQNLNVTQTEPTYLSDYEVPSGGDWSIHRGAAIFVDGATGISIDNVGFDQLGGNGVFFSNYVQFSNVTDSTFWRTGDSAYLVAGSTKLALGDPSSIPQYNTFSGNLIDTVGVYMKQTSCFFKAVTHANSILNNVCYNGPRAGFNFNDGFMGGDLLEGNLVFNMVRETGDHGTFNSWDRRDWVFPCVGNPTAHCMKPAVSKLRHNMFLGPAGWNVDHDDGSSQYESTFNTVYLGGFKYRDGDYRNMTKNIMVQAQPWFQVTGFPLDYFVDNTVVAMPEVCGPDNLGGLSGTTYVTISGQTPQKQGTPLANECDQGTNTTMSWDQLAQSIRALWLRN